jgi:hypothetical protein
VLEAILSFATPGSLTLPNKFSWRVITSWVTFAWILGIVIVIVSVFQEGAKLDTSTITLHVLVVLPFGLCFYGFLGLAVDLARGNKLVYPGWYWYIYPWVTAFWIAVLILLFGLALAGVRFPESKVDRSRRYTHRYTYKQLQETLPEMQVKDFMGDFKKEIVQLENSNQLDTEERQVLKKLKELDVSGLRSDLKEALSNDELEILFRIFIHILELLGMEVI